MPARKVQQQSGLSPFDWPLNGKLRNDIDSLMIGESNFRQLTNLRYVNDGLKGVLGMSKVNAAPTSYLRIDNGFQFVKDKAPETYVFAQTTTGATSRIVKSDNTAAVPNQDTFSTWLSLVNNNRAYFSYAPDSAMMAMDGNTNWIWGGLETRVAKFFNIDPAGTFSYDFTPQVTNTLTDSENKVTLKRIAGSIDAYTALLIHANESDGTAGTSILDSSSAPKTITAAGDAQVDTAQFKYATGSVIFDGTGDYLSLDDHADWYMGTGDWTIDFWIRPTTLAANMGFFQQRVDNDNEVYFEYLTTSNGVLRLVIRDSASTTCTTYCSAQNGNLTINTWHHVAITAKDGVVRITVDGVTQPMLSPSPLLAWPDLAAAFEIGRAINLSGTTEMFTGWIDEFRVSKGIARFSGSFAPMPVAYGSSYVTTVYVASTRKLQGVKLYIPTGTGKNTAVATAYGYEWDGDGWSLLEGISDGTRDTATSTKTMNKTGTISFTSTVATSKIKYFKDAIAYWYQFQFVGMDDNVVVTYATVDAEPQAIMDIWDGIPSPIMSFFMYTPTYYDYIMNVYKQDYYYPDPTSYADIGGLATGTNYLYAGFSERMMGLRFILPDAAYVNAVAGTVAAIDYWNGTAWVDVGYVDDGTSSSGVSLNQSGAMVWQGKESGIEFQANISTPDQLFYYRISFNQTLSAHVNIDHISGIPCQKPIRAHRFSQLWQNRLWLFDDQSENHNEALFSSYNTNCIFNGTDSSALYFGDDRKVVCSEILFTRYSGWLYDNMVVFKNSGVFVVDGFDPTTWKIYTVSDVVGLVAPLTLKKCDVAYDSGPGIMRHVLIFQSSRGIEYFDGNALANISGDIDDFFKPESANHINLAVVEKFSAFYDEKNYEYHWCFATGQNTELNKEYAYDLRRRKWFEVDRGTGKALVSGWNVEDPYGNKYTYAGTTAGYIERCSNGFTFDGNTIVHTLWTGDIPLAKSMMYESEIRNVKVTGIVKNPSTATGTLTYYKDCVVTGESIGFVPPVSSIPRVYQVKGSMSLKAITHGFKMTIQSATALLEFQPYFISGLFRVLREDT